MSEGRRTTNGAHKTPERITQEAPRTPIIIMDKGVKRNVSNASRDDSVISTRRH